MLLESIQNRLQTIYDLESGYRVTDFLITNREQMAALDRSENTREIEEKLLVRQDPEQLLVSLYIDQSVIDSLGDQEPLEMLNGESVATYCTALEGVSHFLYLTWNAKHDRPVSQLELELQAEVDKFVSLLSLFQDQGRSISTDALATWLFDDCSFDQQLEPYERDRYEAASAYASMFCGRLIQGLPRSRIDAASFTELRRFYRKRHQEKLRHCNENSVILGP